jgi:hypothetical protein
MLQGLKDNVLASYKVRINNLRDKELTLVVTQLKGLALFFGLLSTFMASCARPSPRTRGPNLARASMRVAHARAHVAQPRIARASPKRAWPERRLWAEPERRPRA